MPIEVGGTYIHQKIYVFQGKLSYNLLLGIPWIHKIRDVTFTLHRSIKFMYKDRIVTIHAEENATYLCQETHQFWIPYHLVNDEEGIAKSIKEATPQVVSMRTYQISNLDIWQSFKELRRPSSTLESQ